MDSRAIRWIHSEFCQDAEQRSELTGLIELSITHTLRESYSDFHSDAIARSKNSKRGLRYQLTPNLLLLFSQVSRGFA